MKKLVLHFLPVVIIFLFSCKNTNIFTPVTPAISVLPLADNPDAPPPGTPVLETPQQYNQYITDRQQKLNEYIHQINDVANVNTPGANSKMQELTTQIKRLTTEIKAMPPYMGSDALQNAAVAFFEFYESKYHGFANNTEVNTPSEDARILKTEEISTNENKLIAAFQVQQQIFADVNHFVLQTYTTLQPRADYLN